MADSISAGDVVLIRGVRHSLDRNDQSPDQISQFIAGDKLVGDWAEAVYQTPAVWIVDRADREFHDLAPCRRAWRARRSRASVARRRSRRWRIAVSVSTQRAMWLALRLELLMF